MVVWILFLSGLALLIVVILLCVAISRAERRARRSLFRSLGLNEETVELLMDRNGDVLSELALVRVTPPPIESDSTDTQRDSATLASSPRKQPAIRLVHPVPEEAEHLLEQDQRYSNRNRSL